MDNEKKKDKKGFKEHDPSKYINTQPVLDEAASGKTAVVTFGRMNPITIGHEKLVNKVVSEAASRKAVPMVFLSHSSDPKKNPLSYNNKIKFAQQAFGKVVISSKARTIIEVAKSLSGKYGKLVVVVGQDRVKEFSTLLQKYNGKDYKFEQIDIVSAGQRDPDSDGVEGMSASKMRSLAAEGDLNQFKKGLPKKLQRNAEEVYKAVRTGMSIEEQLDEALSRAGRRKRAMAMRRARAKIKLGRERARKKRASMETLKKRARKSAINKLKDRFSRHKRYSDMTPAEKEQIEKRIAKVNKSRIERMAQKELIYVKRRDRDKFKKVRTEDLDERFENFLMERKIGPQDPDVKDRPGSQPKEYYKGVDKDKKAARARHFERGSKMSDDNPAAYKPAPGDKEAKTKESKHTKKARAMGYTEDLDWVCGQCNADPCVCGESIWENLIEGLDESIWGQRITKRPHMLMDKNNKPKFDKRFKMFKPKQIQEMNEFDLEEIVDLMEATEEFIAEDAAGKSLKSKAEKSGMPVGILRKVYNRGVAAWRTGHRPGTTPEQWGHARVNSFITKSSGTWGKADKDLADKVRGSKKNEDFDINEKFEAFLNEKLKASDDMGTWIKDFYDSDAPQFKGKSKDKRRQMAIAAKLDAERNEETEIDELSMSLKDLTKSGVGNVSKAMKADKTRKELEALKKRLNKEEHGAGDEGTDELVKKFKKDTPNA